MGHIGAFSRSFKSSKVPCLWLKLSIISAYLLLDHHVLYMGCMHIDLEGHKAIVSLYVLLRPRKRLHVWRWPEPLALAKIAAPYVVAQNLVPTLGGSVRTRMCEQERPPLAFIAGGSDLT